jgi:putative PIN family toxin of toxin-antitoxin system
MIIVLDTNVIVSGILRPYSKAASILRLVATGAITLAYDLRIFSEYRDVLNRPKFAFAKEDKEDIDAFLDQVEKEGVVVSVMPLKFRLPDPEDESFLEVALAGKAPAIVTGNKRHFPKKEYGGTKILSPAEFLEGFGNSI